MEDITPIILQFKEAVRHIWNTYFIHSLEPMSPDIQEAFSATEKGLFQALVLIPLGMSKRVNEYRERPLSFITVRPSGFLHEWPLQLGEYDTSGNVRWRMPTSVPISEAPILHFFDFFDWHPYSYIDLPYVRAKIVNWPTNPSMQDAIVLVEQPNCRFFFIG